MPCSLWPLAEAVVIDVLAVALHPPMMVQSVNAMVLAVGLAVFPFKYEVESEIVSVQCGTPVLPVQNDALATEVAEDFSVEDGSQCGAELKDLSLLSSSSVGPRLYFQEYS